MFKTSGKLMGYLIDYPITRLWSYFYFTLQKRVNTKPIPQKDAALIAANHQNAFLDAFLAASGIDDQVRAMTRADVFNHPIAGPLLKTHGNLPIYRERDGKDAMAKNEEVFALTNAVLMNKGKIMIFPEANCVVEKRVRPLKKGTARMAFMALDGLKESDKLWIVMCGITYSEHTAFRGMVLLKYGQPICISDMKKAGDSEAKIMLNVTRQMEAQLRELTLDYPENIDAQTLDTFLDVVAAVEVGRPRFSSSSMVKWFDFQERTLKSLAGISDVEIHQLTAHAEILRSALHQIRIPVKALERKTRFQETLRFIGLVLTSPFCFAGFVVIKPVTALAEFVVRKFIKETQFITSARFLIGMWASTLWWGILSLVAGFFLGWKFIPVAFAAKVVVSWISLHWFDLASEFAQRMKAKALRKTGNSHFVTAQKAREWLIEFAAKKKQ